MNLFQSSLHKIRNVGIIAHINAGKTTTTERIIYYSGLSNTIGEVDSGSTVTDYLKQERERGITITSAAITYFWKKHKVNLIDTPGHVDFTIEVERSLSVLDGAVTILDSSAGVEAQTVTVWNQANRYQLPNIIYLNKYDKPSANYELCLNEVKSKLGIEPLLLHLPIKGKTGKFYSLVDVVNRTLLRWPESDEYDGTRYDMINITNDAKILQETEKHREMLINKISDRDENFASHVIECDKISDVSAIEIAKGLRNITLNRSASPVLVGSSFKNVGVQALMNAMLEFLPSPVDRLQQIERNLQPDCRYKNHILSSKSFCGFVFKIIHDKLLGPLTFVRIYSGSLNNQMKLLNLRNSKNETVKKIYQAFADDFHHVGSSLEIHSIAVVSGLYNVKTGDILVDPGFILLDEEPAKNVEENKIASQMLNDIETSLDEDLPFRNLSGLFVPNIRTIQPVYYCSIEAPSMLKQKKLETALECLSREDPSFTYEIESMGQMIIKGMGKLHIDVIRDRIETEYGVDSFLGPLQITYLESFLGQTEEEFQLQKTLNSIRNDVSLRIRLKRKPGAGSWSGKQLVVRATPENDLGKIRRDFKSALQAGFDSATRNGPLLGFEVVDCQVELLDFRANNKCSIAIVSSAASQCLTNAIKKCSPILMEPIMLLEVVVPPDYNGVILGDLSTRRSLIKSTTARSNAIVIRSLTPLIELGTYSEHLRVTTSGQGSFSMELHKYLPMSDADRAKVRIC